MLLLTLAGECNTVQWLVRSSKASVLKSFCSETAIRNQNSRCNYYGNLSEVMWSSCTLERGRGREGRGKEVIFGVGAEGCKEGAGGWKEQKQGMLLGRLGRAATFRAGGEEKECRKKGGWLRHLPLLGKGWNNVEATSAPAPARAAQGRLGQYAAPMIRRQGLEKGRLQKVEKEVLQESGEDSGKESGYTR